MAPTVSTYLANKILDKVLRAVDFSTTPVYVSLHNADPGITGASEVTGGSYSRQQDSTAAWNAASARLSTNINAVAWLSMPSAALSHVGLWDSASNGNFLVGSPLVSPATVASGDTFQMNATKLNVTYV